MENIDNEILSLEIKKNKEISKQVKKVKTKKQPVP